MIVYEVFLFFLFSNVLLGKSDGARLAVGSDPFHNRSEEFKPPDENSCKNLDACLPRGRIPEIFCWQSFEYAYCSYNITKNKACHKELVQIAQNLLSVLERSGEFQRCGYYPDPNSVVGFSFDRSRLDLLPCYDFYIYQEEGPHQIYVGKKRCDYFDVCWENMNPSCRDVVEHLNCVTEIFLPIKCRIFRGRQALEVWRYFKKKNIFDLCGIGYNKDENFAHYMHKDQKDDVQCYNLSTIQGFEYSANTNQANVINGNSWFVVPVLGIIHIFVSE